MSGADGRGWSRTLTPTAAALPSVRERGGVPSKVFLCHLQQMSHALLLLWVRTPLWALPFAHGENPLPPASARALCVPALAASQVSSVCVCVRGGGARLSLEDMAEHTGPLWG